MERGVFQLNTASVHSWDKRASLDLFGCEGARGEALHLKHIYSTCAHPSSQRPAWPSGGRSVWATQLPSLSLCSLPARPKNPKQEEREGERSSRVPASYHITCDRSLQQSDALQQEKKRSHCQS